MSPSSNIVRAQNLLSHSQMCSLSTLSALEKSNPEISQLTTRGFEPAWHLRFVVGCIGTAMMLVPDSVDPSDQEKVILILDDTVDKWRDGEGRELLDSLLDYTHRETVQGERESDLVIGEWFWQSARQFRPADRTLTRYESDPSIQRTVGLFVISAVAEIWT